MTHRALVPHAGWPQGVRRSRRRWNGVPGNTADFWVTHASPQRRLQRPLDPTVPRHITPSRINPTQKVLLQPQPHSLLHHATDANTRYRTLYSTFPENWSRTGVHRDWRRCDRPTLPPPPRALAAGVRASWRGVVRVSRSTTGLNPGAYTHPRCCKERCDSALQLDVRVVGLDLAKERASLGCVLCAAVSGLLPLFLLLCCRR